MKQQREMLMSIEMQEVNELNKKCKESTEALKAKFKKTNIKKVTGDIQEYLTGTANDIKAMDSFYDDFNRIIPVYTHLQEVFSKVDELLNNIESTFKASK
jgi:archaellum component FlaC